MEEALRRRTKRKYLVTLQDYVLIYAKDLSEIDDITVPLTDESIQRYYTKTDLNFEKRGPYRTHPLEANKTLDARENLVFPITAPDGTSVGQNANGCGARSAFKEL